MCLPPQHYDAPINRVGRLFIYVLGVEMEGIKVQSGSLGSSSFFTGVILHISPEFKRARDIWRRVDTRMESWKVEKYYIWCRIQSALVDFLYIRKEGL